jgi:hypothetical protein
MKMKVRKEVWKKFLVVIVISLLLIQPFSVYALTSSDAKQDWFDAKKASRDAQEAHRDAKIVWAVDKTEENNKLVIDTGKQALHAALDEAEAWLIWRNLEVEENPWIPAELKETIQEDVDANLAKIDELREDVDGVETRLELGLVFLKMVGNYLELLSDVARNTGYVRVHIANTYADTVEEYEVKLREAAEEISDNEDIMDKLDSALGDLENARENIDNAEEEYTQVVIPGTPILKFANGNQYLRIAKNDLISAQDNLKQAYRLMVSAE